MRSRAARLSYGLAALVAIAAAAFFVIRSERQIASRRANLRTFDLHAREAADRLADLRASQQAYVAAGQGVAFWMPKVAELVDRIQQTVSSLQSSATSPAGATALAEAATTIAEFSDVDKRARDYLRSGQQLMAGDVIFTEGGDTATKTARSVEAARLAEHQATDASEAALRRYEAMALAAGAGVSALIILLLAVTGAGARQPEIPADAAVGGSPAAAEPALPLHRLPPTRAVSPILKAAAQLCTDFGTVQDVNDIRLLLSRAADLIDASGIVVWMGSLSGADLQPLLAHGYTDEMLARLPAVPRSANNAAAAAYRTGHVQIVPSKPGAQSGAIVAPILSARGCIGALSAEIRGGGEASESVEALATIVAAKLAGVIAAPPDEADEARAAL